MSNFWGAYQCEGGYAAPRRIATAAAIRCLLATSRSEKFLFPPFRRTMFLLRKNGSIIHPPQTKTDHQKDGLFLFGGRGWIRTTEAEKQQIYSLPPLATRELAHNGAGDGTRTRNLLITNQLLCQLSYTSDESSPNVESFSTLTDYTI